MKQNEILTIGNFLDAAHNTVKLNKRIFELEDKLLAEKKRVIEFEDKYTKELEESIQLRNKIDGLTAALADALEKNVKEANKCEMKIES
jgi:hypothetical protein